MSPKPVRRQRGEGGLYQRADGMWIGAVDLGVGADGKRRRKTVSSANYAKAAKKLRELRRQVEDAGGDIPTAATTVGQWLDTWVEKIAAPRVRPNTLEQYRSDIRLHIAPAVGRHRIDRLAPQHVRAMHAAITGKGRSSTTALRCHRVLSKALTDAQREGIATRNVASLVDAPRKAVAPRGALIAAEGIALLEHVATHPLGSRWAAALLTGARQGELLGLQRDRVTDRLDLSWQLQRLKFIHGCGDTCGRKRAGSCPQRRIEAPPGYEYRQLHGGLCLTRPKSAKGTRVIPLVDPLATILERHMATTAPGPHNLVWHREGQPLDPSDDSDAWDAACRSAGVPDVPLHAARHTTATLLLEAGVDAHVVAQILGHSEVVTTRGYQHVDLTLSRAAMEALGRGLTRALGN